MLEFSKWTFIVILQFFILIIMAVWSIKQTVMKVLSINGVRSLSPTHTRSPIWVMLKIFTYNLLWLAEYQCKGVVKFNLSNLVKGTWELKNRFHNVVWFFCTLLCTTFRSFLCTVHYFLAHFQQKWLLIIHWS